MTRQNRARLTGLAAVLAIGLAVISWPQAETIPGERLDAAQIRALPDAILVEQVITRLSLRAGSSLSGWRRLPQASQQVYQVRAFSIACSLYSLADQLVANTAFPGAPTLSETAAAFRAVGAEEVAAILEETIARGRSASAALDAWAAHRVPPNPFADQDIRLRKALADTDIEALLRIFIRQQAEALADP